MKLRVVALGGALVSLLTLLFLMANPQASVIWGIPLYGGILIAGGVGFLAYRQSHRRAGLMLMIAPAVVLLFPAMMTFVDTYVDTGCADTASCATPFWITGLLWSVQFGAYALAITGAALLWRTEAN